MNMGQWKMQGSRRRSQDKNSRIAVEYSLSMTFLSFFSDAHVSTNDDNVQLHTNVGHICTLFDRMTGKQVGIRRRAQAADESTS